MKLQHVLYYTNVPAYIKFHKIAHKKQNKKTPCKLNDRGCKFNSRLE